MKVFICMDDEDCIDYLSELLHAKAIDENMIIDSYTDYVHIIRLPQRDSYNVAFIGDCIGEKMGFQIGCELHEVNPECLIIYIGNDYTYMHESFRSYGFQMLLKKELGDLFDSEFQRIWKYYRELYQQIIFDLEDGGTRLFLPSEIVYIETNRFRTQLVTNHQRYYGHFHNLIRTKNQLLDYCFFQMHPNYFVNMNEIVLIRNGEVEMSNGDCIPTSIMNKGLINDAIQSFLARV